MATVAALLVLVVALIHTWIVVLEMFLWRTPRGLRAFEMDQDFADRSATLAANQGLYNGFLVAGLVWGLLAGDPVGFQVHVFFLACVIVAGLYGAATVSRRILFVQAVPAAAALVAVIAAAAKSPASPRARGLDRRSAPRTALDLPSGPPPRNCDTLVLLCARWRFLSASAARQQLAYRWMTQHEGLRWTCRSLIPDTSPIEEIVVRGSITFLFIYLLLRVLKRQSGAVSTRGPAVFIVLVADAAQNSLMAGQYTSVADGLLLVTTIAVWAYGTRLARLPRQGGRAFHPPGTASHRQGRADDPAEHARPN